MRRKITLLTKEKPYFRKFYPVLFWYKCDSCKYEFMRELGIYYEFNSNDEWVLKWAGYYCNSCAKQDARFKDVFEK